MLHRCSWSGMHFCAASASRLLRSTNDLSGGACVIGQVRPQPLDCILHLGARHRKTEADEVTALHRVKVDARRGSYSGVAQDVFAELQAVVGKAANIGIDVE